MRFRRRSDACFVIGILVICLPFALYAVLAWLPIVLALWNLPAGGWQVLATLGAGVLELMRVPRPGALDPLPRADGVARSGARSVDPPLTPAQQARYDDMRAKGWSELAAKQACARLPS